MLGLLEVLKVAYGEDKEYQMKEWAFDEHFRVIKEKIKDKEQKELSGCSLESPFGKRSFGIKTMVCIWTMWPI
jgi:hypothetical protein